MPPLPEWCPVASTLEVIGGKWTPLILFHLKDQPRRFNELRRLMPAITQRMLTLQLRVAAPGATLPNSEDPSA